MTGAFRHRPSSSRAERTSTLIGANRTEHVLHGEDSGDCQEFPVPSPSIRMASPRFRDDKMEEDIDKLERRLRKLQAALQERKSGWIAAGVIAGTEVGLQLQGGTSHVIGNPPAVKVLEAQGQIREAAGLLTVAAMSSSDPSELQPVGYAEANRASAMMDGSSDRDDVNEERSYEDRSE